MFTFHRWSKSGSRGKSSRNEVDISGGYGDDVLAGSNGNEFLYGGHGEDRLRGSEGDDILYSSSDGREPVIAQEYDRRDDPDNEIHAVTRTHYAYQPIDANDVLVGGAGRIWHSSIHRRIGRRNRAAPLYLDGQKQHTTSLSPAAPLRTADHRRTHSAPGLESLNDS